jgi:hypothetical protein
VPSVETFVARVRTLTDEDRVAVANARRVVDETFHERALRAGLEALAERDAEYLKARRALADAHLPARLDPAGEDLQSAELAHWNDVARLVQQALDDALIAILASGSLHPNHLRELYRSLKAASGQSS